MNKNPKHFEALDFVDLKDVAPPATFTGYCSNCAALQARAERAEAELAAAQSRLKLVNAINRTFADPEGWQKRADAAEAEVERLREALVPLLRHRPDGDIGWRGQHDAICGDLLVSDILRIEKALGREFSDIAPR